MVDHFLVRGLPWQGEKSAIRFWKSHDPEYYDLFTKCLGENDQAHKIYYYGELSAATMAPIGSLWTTGATGFRLSPESEMTQENLKSAETDRNIESIRLYTALSEM